MRELDGQVLVFFRNDTAFVAVNDRDRRAPKSLARDSPVANAKCGRGISESVRFGEIGHFPFRVLAGFSGPFAGVHQNTVVGECFRSGGKPAFLTVSDCVARFNNGLYWQAEFLSKFKIAFVMSGYRHDRTGAVFHHHVVADPNRQFLAAKRIYGSQAGIDAILNGLYLMVGRIQFLCTDRLYLFQNWGRKR